MPAQQQRHLSFTSEIEQRLSDSGLDVVVTGGGGWLGQASLEMLDSCFGDAIASRVHVFGSSARSLILRSGRSIPCRELADLSGLSPRPCLVLHYAFVTRDKVGKIPLEDFINRNEAISALVAKEATRLQAAGIFVPSSGAVYRADRSIDDDLERNPYGVMKARDEQRFLALAETKLRPRITVCRVFNLAGPFINKVDSYALASILIDIERGGPIRLRANRPVLRSYVHVRDVVDLAAALLLSGGQPPVDPFDTTGELIIEIGELARRAATLLENPKMTIDRPAFVSEVADCYVGDGSTMATLLSSNNLALCSLDTQILDTAGYLRKTAV